uniref:Putative ovule protein n=1 Tax=Solanum chacoense TaxID=4108 RepID=A0A0V0GQW9_SOLCH
MTVNGHFHSYLFWIYLILFYLFLLEWIENSWKRVSAFIVCTHKHIFISGCWIVCLCVQME